MNKSLFIRLLSSVYLLQVPVGDRMGSSPFIRTKISDFKRFLARNRLFFCLFMGIIYALRGMNGEYFTIHSTYYLLYEGKHWINRCRRYRARPSCAP